MSSMWRVRRARGEIGPRRSTRGRLLYRLRPRVASGLGVRFPFVGFGAILIGIAIRVEGSLKSAQRDGRRRRGGRCDANRQQEWTPWAASSCLSRAASSQIHLAGRERRKEIKKETERRRWRPPQRSRPSLSRPRSKLFALCSNCHRTGASIEAQLPHTKLRSYFIFFYNFLCTRSSGWCAPTSSGLVCGRLPMPPQVGHLTASKPLNSSSLNSHDSTHHVHRLGLPAGH